MASNSHELAKGLRRLADKLESAEPFEGADHTYLVLRYFTKAPFIASARVLGGEKKTKKITNTFALTSNYGPLEVETITDKNLVCRLVEPAREAVYDCDPLLTPDDEKEIGYAAV